LIIFSFIQFWSFNQKAFCTLLTRRLIDIFLNVIYQSSMPDVDALQQQQQHAQQKDKIEFIVLFPVSNIQSSCHYFKSP